MSFNLPDLMGLAMALHGYGNAKAAQQDPGFLSRYTRAVQNPLTSPTQAPQSGPGLLSILGDAAQGKFQPGSLAGSLVPAFTPGTAANPVSLPEQSVTYQGAPKGAPQGGPGGAPQGAPQGGPGGAPQGVPPDSVQGPPAPLQGAPLPPLRPSDQELYAQAGTQGGPQGSTPTIWGANYHGPEASLWNRLAASQGANGATSDGPGSGLKAFTDSGAPSDFMSSFGPNLKSFFGLG
jgi:hypothetical protein